MNILNPAADAVVLQNLTAVNLALIAGEAGATASPNPLALYDLRQQLLPGVLRTPLLRPIGVAVGEGADTMR